MRLHERVAFTFRIRKAMSLQQAKDLLGLMGEGMPSQEEVAKAYRQKAFVTHPDRGGDQKDFIQVTEAKNYLDGIIENPYKVHDPGPDVEPRGPYTPKPFVKDHVTWEEAATKAGVPSGVRWVLSMRKYAKEGFDTTYAMFAFLGQVSDEQWITVSVQNTRTLDSHAGVDLDKYSMLVQSYSGSLQEVGVNAFKHAWRMFGGQPMPTKVIVLNNVTQFAESALFKGRDVALKDAIDLLSPSSSGAEDSLVTPGKKLKIEMELRNEAKWPEPEDHSITLVVNGRQFKLSKPHAEMIEKRTKLIKVIFGDYPSWVSHNGRMDKSSSKVLTLLKRGKEILSYLAEKLEGEPPALIEALKAAAAGMK